ncbi:hypothetical protein AX14_009123 [Amanita brunnescens Koide BX004]|nr:hypothetical protein AX14_009123 [Amanita brunnescens Koide BX004]
MISSESQSEAFSDLSSGLEDLDECTPELSTDVKHIQAMVKFTFRVLFEHARTHASTSDLASTAMSVLSSTPLPDLPTLSPSPLMLSPPPPPPSLTPGSSTPAEMLTKRATSLAAPDLLRSQFHTLLSMFHRTILRTFKSRYTQFHTTPHFLVYIP